MKFTPKSAFLASLALVALTGSTYASEDAEPVVDKGDIVVLNKTSFDTVVKPEVSAGSMSLDHNSWSLFAPLRHRPSSSSSSSRRGAGE